MSEWIMVEDRIPDDGQNVIAFVDSAFVVAAQYRNSCFYDVLKDADGSLFETVSRDVTHWQPLPEPPK